ncbi:biopolymer transporter ExbD [Mangrovivirga sp. M17]|uniref:Biopolymer transporter ExbD n=1 Tax=Mangrovivirga halotolerans TaxID=2993936 RepID=A0ABT3RPJ1_9BACT|nr:biopolymer transporter ExbD [Mangrovivirga halotolerans]MCX2743708.1 biopolymer transporter ExbD [Mangrovivirga halotolerans]
MARNRQQQEVNAGSMADIAFLLLIFFLVTTQINSDKGLQIKLPPKADEQDKTQIDIPDRNLFKILINSNDQLLVEDEILNDPNLLKGLVYEFINNNGENSELSDSPLEGVVSIKTDRGTSYDLFIKVLDQVQGAYYKSRGSLFGLSATEYLNLDPKNPKQKAKIDKAKESFPMRISIAEPNKIGG